MIGATFMIASRSSSVSSMPLRARRVVRDDRQRHRARERVEAAHELVARRLEHVRLRQHQQPLRAGFDHCLRVADRLPRGGRGHAGHHGNAAGGGVDREPRQARALVGVEVPALAVVAGDADRRCAQSDQPARRWT